MPIFYCSWKIFETNRKDTCTLFAAMSLDDHKNQEGKDVNILGRWHNTGDCGGFLVAEAKDVVTFNKWVYGWIPMCDIQTQVVLDDDDHRAILLKRLGKPAADWKATQARETNAEPKDGETIYFIRYAFNPGMVMKGFEAFACMTQEQDQKDCGACAPMGRWHNAGTGSGIAVCAAKSAKDVYGWAVNWAGICVCEVTPVVTDAQARDIIRGNPDFKTSLTAFHKKLGFLPGGVKTVEEAMKRIGL